MNQNVSEEAGKASAANEQMTKSVETMQKEIERLQNVVQDMSTALAEQRKQTAGSGDEFDNSTKKIDAMQAALDRANLELAVYRATTEQMNKAVQDGADIADVLVDAEKGLAETKGALIDNAKELISNQEDINQKLDTGSKSADTYSASNQILSVAIKGVCQGLGIENTQIVNAIGNVRVIQAAKTGWANAVKILNTQLGFTITQSKIMLGLGLATGLGTIVAVVAVLASHFKKLKEEQEEITRLNKIVSDSLKAAASEGEKAAKKETVALKLLYDASQKEANSKQDRITAANELQRLYPKYFSNLSQEEILAGKGADAYNRLASSIIAAAKARAAQDKIVENETKKLELEEKRTQAIADKEQAERNKEAAGYKYNAQNSGGNPYAANAMNMMRGKEMSEATADIEEYNKTIWQTTKEIGKLDEANRELAEGINVNDLIKETKTPAAKKTKTKDDEKEATKAAADLEKKAYDYRKRIDAATVKAIHEGAEKEREAAKAEYDQTQAFLEREYRSVAELEKKTGKPATEQRTLLLSLDVEATRQYEAETGRINAQAKATLDGIFTEVNTRFASELDRNITSITQYYAELVREATKAGATITQIEELNAARDKDIQLARLDNRQTVIDFETDMALRKEELTNKTYLFQADKEKELLQIQLAGLQQTEQAMQEAYDIAPTEELAANLKKVKAQQDEVNKKIEKLPAQKFKEVAGYISDVSDALMKTLGDLGVSLSEDTQKTVEGLNQVLSGLASIDVTKPVSAITGGLTALGGLAKTAFGIFGGADYSEYTDLKSKYDALLGIWNDLIDKKNEYLRTSTADEVRRVEQETLDLINKQADAVRKLAQARLEAGKSSGSHSIAYRMWDSKHNVFDGKTWKDVSGEISAQLGVAFNSMSDMLDMSADQLQWIKENYSGLWSVMDADYRGYLEQIIEYADQAQEAIKAAKEAATGISFDSLKDNFLNTLSDMSSSAEDFSNDFAGYMQKAILKSMIDRLYADKLQEFYDNFADYNSNDGQISDSEYTRLQNQWQDIVNNALAERDKLMGIFGWESEASRTGASQGFATASQDSINELTGGVYAVRQIVGDIRNDNREELLIQRTITGQLSVLVERSEYWLYLEELPRVVKKLEDIDAYGLKMKLRE
ncbi:MULTISPECIES: hypothetical protein [unclassified Dysgonomonas]|uniref:hypothetical protein n=1 Tax=unclassified Dysgonomonas TaxID=2630389 RepID=UPI0024754B9E|nr:MULTISPECIES: hypothetical protein [unclassified Dysgonomonas]